MFTKRVFAAIFVAGVAALAANANAGVIFSATSATIDSSGPGNGNINDTFNQNGLASTYTSGVTDFNTYIAGNPLHTTTFSGFEWFGNQNTNDAIVTYNFGSTRTFDALALWNEESSGIGLLTLLTSNDGVNFTNLASGLTPTDHSLADYPADVFSFGPVTAQYVRFDMSRCPQPIAEAFTSCAIGEVAFREASNGVPEPASLLLAGLGLLGFAARRRKQPAA